MKQKRKSVNWYRRFTQVFKAMFNRLKLFKHVTGCINKISIIQHYELYFFPTIMTTNEQSVNSKIRVVRALCICIAFTSPSHLYTECINMMNINAYWLAILQAFLYTLKLAVFSKTISQIASTTRRDSFINFSGREKLLFVWCPYSLRIHFYL